MARLSNLQALLCKALDNKLWAHCKAQPLKPEKLYKRH